MKLSSTYLRYYTVTVALLPLSHACSYLPLAIPLYSFLLYPMGTVDTFSLWSLLIFFALVCLLLLALLCSKYCSPSYCTLVESTPVLAPLCYPSSLSVPSSSLGLWLPPFAFILRKACLTLPFTKREIRTVPLARNLSRCSACVKHQEV